MGFFFGFVAITTVVLWVVAVVALIGAMKKTSDYPCTRRDVFFYVLDAVLVCLYLFCNMLFFGFGMSGTVEGWQKILLNITDVVAFLIVPVSIWSIAVSISLRKEGNNRRSRLMQFSCIPGYVFCLIVYCTLFPL